MYRFPRRRCREITERGKEMKRDTNNIRPAIVGGVIAVANHKLRLEGLESYKEFLGKTFYFVEDIHDALKEGEDYERNRILEILKKARKRDSWGYSIIEADWDGLMSLILQKGVKKDE